MLKTKLGFCFTENDAAVYGQIPAVDRARRNIRSAGAAGERCASARLLPTHRRTSLQ
jgi:hypothetical protein